MAAAKNNGLTLRITGPDGSTVESVSEAESIIVGSGAQAAVKIQDPRVSNLHVMLKVDKDGSVTAIDLGSESGTEVRGQRLVLPTALKPGDVLTVGASRVEVLFGATEPLRHSPAGAKVAGPVFQAPVTPHRPPPMTVPEVVTPPAVHNTPRLAAAPGSGNRMEASASGGVSMRTERPVAPMVPPVAPPVANKMGPSAQQARPAAVKPAMPAHLQDPLPPEAMPAPEAKVLQVAMLWGDQMLEVQHFKDGVPVTIGEGKKNFFHVYTPAVGQRHVLAVSHADKLEVRAPAGAGLIVTNRGDVRSKEALRATGALTGAVAQDKEQVLTLGLHDRVEVSLGTVSFVARYVRPTPTITANSLAEADFTFFKITSICLMAGLAVIMAMVLTPRAEQPESADIFNDQQRVAKFLIAPEKKLEQKKLQLTGVEEGEKAKDEEGKFGKEEAKQAEAAPSKPGTPVVDKNKKEKDRQVVGKVGLLGAFKGMKGGASDVFGPGGFGTGLNNALGGLKGGAAMGDAQGVGGLGSRGTG
ncbi:FHA domain-containing protein, partial [Pyxidicoccus sp. 3LFB2]